MECASYSWIKLFSNKMWYKWIDICSLDYTCISMSLNCLPWWTLHATHTSILPSSHRLLINDDSWHAYLLNILMYAKSSLFIDQFHVQAMLDPNATILDWGLVILFTSPNCLEPYSSLLSWLCPSSLNTSTSNTHPILAS